MKNIIVLLVSLCSAFSLFGQNNDIPETVLAAFNTLEPQITNPFWELREGAFVAMFPHEDGLKKMFFNQDGKWLETRTRMKLEALPEGINRFIAANYAEADITYIGQVKKSDRTLYRVESELSSSVVIKLLNEQGELLDEHRIDWSPNFY